MTRLCRQCGCSDADCSQCVAKTGQPCRWVEYDLCSACASEQTSSIERCVANWMRRMGAKASRKIAWKGAVDHCGRRLTVAMEPKAGLLTVTDHVGMVIFWSTVEHAWRAPHYSADELTLTFAGISTPSREATNDHHRQTQPA